VLGNRPNRLVLHPIALHRSLSPMLPALGLAIVLFAREAAADGPLPVSAAAPAFGEGNLPKAKGATQPGRFLRFTWDANVEGALGGMFLDPTRLIGFTRVRAGLLVVDEQDLKMPRFYSLGLTYEASNFLHVTSAVGLQAELMLAKSLVWGQLGVVSDFQPRPGFNASVGWSLFGLEGQMRWDGERTQGELVWGVFGKLRLPVSWFFVGRSR
jgi:hypothetical protein